MGFVMSAHRASVGAKYTMKVIKVRYLLQLSAGSESLSTLITLDKAIGLTIWVMAEESVISSKVHHTELPRSIVC